MTRSELIETYWDWNVSDDRWFERIYADFRKRMAAVGVCVDDIYFSGFWSQGDGACFDGGVLEWDLFLEELGIDDPVLAGFAEHAWGFRAAHRGHGSYYHEHTVTFHIEMELPGDDPHGWRFLDYSPYSADDLRTAATLAVLRQYDAKVLEEEAKEYFREQMRRLYRELEEEYEYLTSDDVVWEALVANGVATALEKED